MLAAGAILLITMGARQTSGLFLIPITQSTGVSIVAMSFALAVGQFVFGAAQPIFGAIADKYGAVKVVVAGAIMLALGCALTPFATSSSRPAVHHGCAVGGRCRGRQFLDPDRHRRAAPAAREALVRGRAHQCRRLDRAVRVRAGRAAHHRRGGLGERDVRDGVRRAADDSVGAAAATFDSCRRGAAASLAPVPHLTLGEQLRVALRDPSYLCLHAGFFTCGFHIAFLVTHLPNDLRLCGLGPEVAASSLMLIGLFNVAGSLSAGWLGQRYRMKYLLALIYASRAAIVAIYVVMPKTALNVYLFAGALGFTWLATVPPTSGLVGKLFGTRYLATLFGLTLLSHQIGGFLGAWLGGVALAQTGNYEWIWYADIALALLAAAVNLPIREAQLDAQPATA